MAKLCVQIYKQYTQIDLGEFRLPVTSYMTTYKGMNLEYQSIDAKPQWIQVLQCSLFNMVFPKYNGVPPQDGFLAFGGFKDNRVYILEERLDGVYIVGKIYTGNQKKRQFGCGCFGCRSTNSKCFGYAIFSIFEEFLENSRSKNRYTRL